MRAAWLLFTEFPNGPALTSAGVDTVFVDARTATSASLDELRKFFKVGIVYDPSWFVSHGEFDAMSVPQKTAWAKKAAKQFSQYFTDLASPSFGANVKQCIGLLDNEYHSSLFMREFHIAFRLLRNLRFFIWTMESFQGGWMETDLVARINADNNILLAPQRYGGDMKVFDGGEAALDLVDSKIKRERICSFIGLRDERHAPVRIPERWSGVLYVENKAQNDGIPQLI